LAFINYRNLSGRYWSYLYQEIYWEYVYNNNKLNNKEIEILYFAKKI